MMAAPVGPIPRRTSSIDTTPAHWSLSPEVKRKGIDAAPSESIARMRPRLLRASVGSTEASNGRLARVGVIDRSTSEVFSRLDFLLYACHPRLVNGYFPQT
jgi:hypothetical protein